MRRRLRRRLVLMLLLASVSCVPGCLLAALGVGAGVGAGATWYLSAAREEVVADPRRVIAAAAEVFDDMDIVVERKRASALDGEIIGHTARDERVEIVAESRAKSQTEVRVRVGLVDDDAARRILDRVLKRL